MSVEWVKRVVFGGVLALAGVGPLAWSEELTRSGRIDRLFDVSGLRSPAFSPDGQWVAYVDAGEIWRVATKGGESERLVPWQASLSGAEWSPTGHWLAYFAADKEGRLQVWGLPATGAPRQLTTLRVGNVTGYWWSPGGERLAVSVDEPVESLTVPGRSGGEKTYTGDPVSLEYKDADVRDVLLKFSEISGLNFVLDAKVRGRVTMRFIDGPWDEALDRVLKANGLGYELDDTTVRIVVLEEGAKGKREPRVIRSLTFKREGVGYVGAHKSRVAVIDVRSGQERDVDVGDLEVHGLAWSPDGTKLAFAAARPIEPTSNSPLDFDLYVVPADGSASPRAVLTAPGGQYSPLFAADGREVVYLTAHEPSAFPYSGSDLGLVRLVDGAARRLGPALDRDIGALSLSADGKAVLFLIEDGGCVHLARVDVRTGRLERLLAGEREVEGFSQAKDGRLVVAEGDGQRAAEIAIVERRKTRLLASPNKPLEGLGLGKVERWRVRSGDGTAVDGFIVRPPDVGGSPKPGPAILWLHGGPNAQATVSFNRHWQSLALAGYTVIAPNPRGSSGYGTAYSAAIKGAWGSLDLDDVIAALDTAIAAGIVDPQRVGVGGWSYGAWLTNHILTRTTRFRAALSGSGISNVFADLGVSDTQTRLEAELGLPWENREAWLRQSPWFDAQKVKTPTLVLCGEDDIRTPLVQSELWYYALRRLGVETELVIYPGEGHSTRYRETAMDEVQRTVAWFDRFLIPAPERTTDPSDSNAKGVVQ